MRYFNKVFVDLSIKIIKAHFALLVLNSILCESYFVIVLIIKFVCRLPSVGATSVRSYKDQTVDSSGLPHRCFGFEPKKAKKLAFSLRFLHMFRP